MSYNLTNKVKTIKLHAPVSAGSTDVTDSTVVDMQNFEGVRFLVGFGAITAGGVQGVKVKQATAKTSATALTNGADLAGTLVSVADDDDNDIAIVDIYRPLERYLQPVVTRATQNSVVEFVIAEQYGAKKLPVVQDSTVPNSETHASPSEGTA